MPEERTLVANLVPQIEDADMQRFMEELRQDLKSEISIEVEAKVSQKSPVTEGLSNDEMSEVTDVLKEQGIDNKELQREMAESMREMQEYQEWMAEVADNINSEVPEKLDGIEWNGPKVINVIMMAIEMIGEVFISAIRLVINTMMKAWDFIQSKSPFLRGIIDSFKNVMDLIIGPIGVAMGVELIPLLKEVYDVAFKGVQAMWEAYEDGGLEAMMKEAINTLWGIISEYLIPIFETISTMVNELVAQMIDKIFGPGSAELFRDLWQLVKWLLKTFVGVGNFLGTATENNLVAPVKNGIDFWSKLLSGDFGGAWDVSKESSRGRVNWGGFFANGGEVQANPPYGTLVSVGEHETEYIVPQSKTQSFAKQVLGGNVTYNLYFYGYTDEDIQDKIISVIDQRTDMARAMGGL